MDPAQIRIKRVDQDEARTVSECSEEREKAMGEREKEKGADEFLKANDLSMVKPLSGNQSAPQNAYPTFRPSFSAFKYKFLSF